MVLLTVHTQSRMGQFGAENDIDRASLHNLSIEVTIRSNFHAFVRSELLKWKSDV